METSKKVINVGIILTLIAGFTIVGVTTQPPTHYCEERGLKAYCYELSSTSKTCYTLPARTGGKRCTEWKEIPIVPDIVTVSGNVLVCDKEKCK